MLRNEWLAHLDGLVVFRGLLAAEPLCTLRAALAADDAEQQNQPKAPWEI